MLGHAFDGSGNSIEKGFCLSDYCEYNLEVLKKLNK